MNQSELIVFAEDFFNQSIELMKKKNNDYASGGQIQDTDAFRNLTASKAFGISPGIGFITRMCDKMSRISTFVQKGDLLVKEESVTDTLRDLSNYAMLMAAWIESQKPK